MFLGESDAEVHRAWPPCQHTRHLSKQFLPSFLGRGCVLAHEGVQAALVYNGVKATIPKLHTVMLTGLRTTTSSCMIVQRLCKEGKV